MILPERATEILRKFSTPGEQKIRVGQFYQCYDILLSNQKCGLKAAWTVTKERIRAHNDNSTSSGDSVITRQHLQGEASATVPNWPVVYLLTMLWGFGKGRKGSVAKDGPAKLFASTLTMNVREKLDAVAGLVAQGRLDQAYDQFCPPNRPLKLHEIAESFGTKFLFAVGLRLPADANARPLVLDQRVRKSLKALGASVPKSNGTDYEAYCRAITETAPLLELEAYELEQLLFERNGDFDAR